MSTDWWSFVLPLAVVLAWFVWTWWLRQHAPEHTATVTAALQRLLKPRSGLPSLLPTGGRPNGNCAGASPGSTVVRTQKPPRCP
jgi:hypothetical protein